MKNFTANDLFDLIKSLPPTVCSVCGEPTDSMIMFQRENEPAICGYVCEKHIPKGVIDMEDIRREVFGD